MARSGSGTRRLAGVASLNHSDDDRDRSRSGLSILRHGYRAWAKLVIDPRHALASAWRFRRYLREWRAYREMPEAEPLRFIESQPCLTDRSSMTAFDAHYFYQAVWAMEQISHTVATAHVDVGSDVGFVGMLTTHVPVTFVDIRPLVAPGVRQLTSVGGSLLSLPFASGSIPSLSCMHVIEHVGLGRYGDPLNPAGSRLACAELARVLAPGGYLFLSTPVGRARVCFNAHRIHNPLQILEFLGPEMELVEFSAVDDRGRLLRGISPLEVERASYACGLFLIRRKDRHAA